MTRSSLLLVAFALLAAACGSSSTTAGSLATTTTVPSATTAVPSSTTTAASVAPSTSTPDETTTTTTLAPLQGLDLQPVAAGLAQPVWVGSPPGDPRVFVVEQPGRIRLIADGILQDRPFLDITDRVGFGGERGLLGLAFHPDFAANGRLFVDYTDAGGTTTVSEFRVEADPAVVDPATERVVLTVPQPASNHNGGMVAFGPDGYLYIGMGDGGGSGDRFGQAQRSDTLLGAMLRIDVDGAGPYAIPPDNPYVAGGGAPEVWATGLRNPWRFGFDGDLLYIGDVGQNAWEEIDVEPAAAGGLNYGWPIIEGTHCYQQAGCDPAGLVLPVVEYSHSDGCSVTGGVVYRGSAIPELDGRYLYSDYCSGWIRSFVFRDGQATDPQELFGASGSVTSFGADATGEVFLTVHTGEVLKLVAVR